MWLLSFRIGVVGLFLLQLVFAGQCEPKSKCSRKLSNSVSRSSLTALVLARGGSKGIPLKNLAQIGDGRSLLSRTLKVLVEFERFNTVWVSTDDPRIISDVKNHFPNGSLVRVHYRSPETSQDDTTSIDSVLEFLSKHPEVENLALVQCTSPFLRTIYLEDAFKKFHRGKKDCVFSAVRSYKLRWKESVDDMIIPVNFNPDKRPRRQDWTGELVETGMFYFARKSLLMQGRFQNDNCGIVEIDYRDALEIDSGYDLELAKMIVQNGGQ
ncbi:N-acylneuraminate cytidylyltransferase [Uranotaenia lowii]|uniref:N-acylneuraminate cytidylyltransferase n=1 Tax=Uranotaenia lowii TaxID=190385 RepID=UPI00247A8071|nr:N-acylneuraminate cytidylyltransferase [Uranotaenia lowii]